MADLSISITNRVNLFGGAPTDKWNAYNWNAFLWGEGTTDAAVSFLKVLSNSITPVDTLTKSPTIVVSNSLAPTTDVTDIELGSGNGYTHVFPGNVTNSDDRVDSSWASGSAGADPWSQATASSTSWSSG